MPKFYKFYNIKFCSSYFSNYYFFSQIHLDWPSREAQTKHIQSAYNQKHTRIFDSRRRIEQGRVRSNTQHSSERHPDELNPFGGIWSAHKRLLLHSNHPFHRHSKKIRSLGHVLAGRPTSLGEWRVRAEQVAKRCQANVDYVGPGTSTN